MEMVFQVADFRMCSSSLIPRNHVGDQLTPTAPADVFVIKVARRLPLPMGAKV
jgi:hypothetical protein